MYLITLAQAKRHLRITDNLQDHDVEDKRLQASAIVLDYILADVALGEVSTDSWFDSLGDPLMVPAHVQAACMLILGNLYYNREGLDGETITPAVESLLRRTRPYIGG